MHSTDIMYITIRRWRCIFLNVLILNDGKASFVYIAAGISIEEVTFWAFLSFRLFLSNFQRYLDE